MPALPSEIAPATGPGGSEPVLAARDLTKRFGSQAALRGVGFEAHRGELLAVIGPNGAGKTTLLSILAGIYAADEGEVSRPAADVGWVPQQAAVYRRLTVAENLRLFARLEGVADVDGAVESMLAQAGLAERRDDQVAKLSGGNQQRVNVAAGLLRRPPVLLLDEPSAALDPRQRERLWRFIAELASAGTTVVFSTHDIQEAERYGHRLLVLADGEALFHGTPNELRARVAAEDAEGAGRLADFESAFVAFLRHHGH